MATYMSSHPGPLVPHLGVELDDEALLLGGEGALLEVGPQVVRPPEAAALAAAGQPRVLLHRVPVPLAVLLDVVQQDGILRRRPGPFLQGRAPARRPAVVGRRRRVHLVLQDHVAVALALNTVHRAVSGRLNYYHAKQSNIRLTLELCKQFTRYEQNIRLTLSHAK
jgi:hypothetical protein